MRTYTEERGQYIVNCYELDITPLMKKIALDFSTQIIENNDQFDRLLPQNAVNIDDQTLIRIQRTYMGKLGELAFADFLLEKRKQFSTKGMFQIYPGENNVDDFDFVDSMGHTIDVKTGFRSCHHLLAINLQQFDNIPKDYYVAVLLNATDTNADLTLVDLNSVTTAKILGYADYEFLRENANTRNLGEGLCRIREYRNLLGIDRLLNSFQDAN